LIPLGKKIVKGPSSLMGGALVKLGHFLAPVKIWGAAPPRGQNMAFQKVDLGG